MQVSLDKKPNTYIAARAAEAPGAVMRWDDTEGNLGGLPKEDPGIIMRWDDAERFLASHEKKGRSQATLEKYRLALEQLYSMLPEGKLIYRDTLFRWREELLKEGYLKASVNTKISACNQFLAFIGKREYQVVGQLNVRDAVQPELTRSEYKRLLSAAKMTGDERTYFVVKIFACTGINVQELPLITAENVDVGRFTSIYQGVTRNVWIPACLRNELLAYAGRNGISRGSLFITRSGKPLNRTTVTGMISSLSEPARVPKEKCNPRCIRKLYLSARAAVEANIEKLVEQTMEWQLEQEQLTIGWGA